MYWETPTWKACLAVEGWINYDQEVGAKSFTKANKQPRNYLERPQRLNIRI